MASEERSPAALVPNAMLSRRALLSGALGLGVGALLVACGDDDDDNDEQPTATSAGVDTGSDESQPTETVEEPDPTPGGESGRTIRHIYGETVVTGTPERVITVGLTDQDPVFALGVAPVASQPWYAEQVVYPWAEEALDGIDTAMLPAGDLDIEAVLGREPDLILAITSSITEDEYRLLSEIAPTVAASPDFDAATTPWQEQTLMIGEALGMEERAEELIAEVEQALADAAARHPEWDGAEAVLASQFIDGQLLVYPEGDPAVAFLTELGFVIASGLQEFMDDTYGVATLSAERLELIDVDFVLWDGVRENLEASGLFDLPTYQGLSVVQEGRMVFPSADIADALSFKNVLSLPWALERLEDEIAAAFDGESSSAGTDDPAMRSVETPFGTVEVPSNSERVVALGEEFMLADLLDLGVEPIASTVSLASGFVGLDAFDTSGIEQLSNTETDVERLLELQPDLLVTYTYLAEEIGFDLLNQLAPTVVIDPSDYRTAYRNLAAAFGLEDRAEERLAEYDRTAEEAGADIEASARTVSVVTVYPGAADITVWVGGTADAPQALLDMDFTLVPDAETLPPSRSLSREAISLEQVEMLAGEDLVMMQSMAVEGEEATLEEMTATDLWQRIPAVAAGRVHVVDRLGYPGVPGRIAIVEDLRAALAR